MLVLAQPASSTWQAPRATFCERTKTYSNTGIGSRGTRPIDNTTLCYLGCLPIGLGRQRRRHCNSNNARSVTMPGRAVSRSLSRMVDISTTFIIIHDINHYSTSVLKYQQVLTIGDWRTRKLPTRIVSNLEHRQRTRNGLFQIG